MSADGPEERTAAFEERSEHGYDEIDRAESHAEDELDEALLAAATARMNDFFINKAIDGIDSLVTQ